MNKSDFKFQFYFLPHLKSSNKVFSQVLLSFCIFYKSSLNIFLLDLCINPYNYHASLFGRLKSKRCQNQAVMIICSPCKKKKENDKKKNLHAVFLSSMFSFIQESSRFCAQNSVPCLISYINIVFINQIMHVFQHKLHVFSTKFFQPYSLRSSPRLTFVIWLHSEDFIWWRTKIAISAGVGRATAVLAHTVNSSLESDSFQ